MFNILLPQFPVSAVRVTLKSLVFIGAGHFVLGHVNVAVNLNTPECVIYVTLH